MMNVLAIAIMAITLSACSGGGGGFTASTSPSKSPTIAITPSDEFTEATFNSSRWQLSYLNSSTPIVQSAQGLKIGSNNQNQTDQIAFFATTKYSTQINDIYGDSIIAEFNFQMLNTRYNNVLVDVTFANGKRMVGEVYGEADVNGYTQYYGVVKIYGTDGTTVIYDTTSNRIHLADALDCQNFKIAPNFNATSTAQWNVDFTANCASTYYTTYTALDAASLGATDYVGTSNGNSSYSLIGKRNNADSLDSFYVELLSWNFSNLGATVIAD